MAAIEDTFTIAPPLPPCLVDMRRAASRQQIIRPVTFVANRLASTLASNASTRERTLMPALFSRWVTGPSALVVSSNSRTMSASLAMSALMAIALAPFASRSATTFFASASRVR